MRPGPYRQALGTGQPQAKPPNFLADCTHGGFWNAPDWRSCSGTCWQAANQGQPGRLSGHWRLPQRQPARLEHAGNWPANAKKPGSAAGFRSPALLPPHYLGQAAVRTISAIQHGPQLLEVERLLQHIRHCQAKAFGAQARSLQHRFIFTRDNQDARCHSGFRQKGEQAGGVNIGHVDIILEDIGAQRLGQRHHAAWIRRGEGFIVRNVPPRGRTIARRTCVIINASRRSVFAASMDSRPPANPLRRR